MKKIIIGIVVLITLFCFSGSAISQTSKSIKPFVAGVMANVGQHDILITRDQNNNCYLYILVNGGIIKIKKITKQEYDEQEKTLTNKK